MDALTLRAEKGQVFHGPRPGVTEPMRCPGIELRGFARAEHEVLLAENQTEPPAEDVEPLVSVMGLRVGCLWPSPRRDHMFEGLESTGAAGEWEDGHSLAGERARVNAGVAGEVHPDQLVERELVSLSQREQEIEIRSTLTRLQS